MAIKKDYFKAQNEINKPEHWDPIKGIGPYAMRLYMYLIQRMAGETMFLQRRYQTIHEDIGVPVRTLKTWMKQLDDNGYIAKKGLHNR